MAPFTSRRRFLKLAGATAVGGCVAPNAFAADTSSPSGYVVGEPTAEKAGSAVLARGGNAFDAIVAAALAAAVVAPSQTGIGGYGAHGIFAVAGAARVLALDANSKAPAAMRADTFKPDANGQVPGRVNDHGWLAAGVPGILAGLQLVLERFGTWSFGDIAQPAIALARDGFIWPAALTAALEHNPDLRTDVGSRKLYFAEGKPVVAGTRWKNPDLAAMLESLAKANSVEAFYRGDIARMICDAFAKNGGLVTVKDMAAYQARLVEPLSIEIGGHVVHTAPLTAGGLTVLQALKTMRAMKWDTMPADMHKSHARIEALRLAWRDRLTLLGDCDFGQVPVAKLLSDDYASESAAKIQDAVKSGKLLTHAVTPTGHTGTVNLSAIDKKGNIAVLTLTHGQAFGAQVTVDGLGLTLGHGMSRFDPNPQHPNAPGPGKRPLDNMTPTLVTRDGKPLLGIGGAGGRKIPNAIFETLTQFLFHHKSLDASMAAPRMHTEGTAAIELEKHWPADDADALAKLGYEIKIASSARLSAVAMMDGAMWKGRR